MRPPINRMKKFVTILSFVSPIFVWSNTITISPDTLYVSMQGGGTSIEQVTIYNQNSFPVNLDVLIIEQPSGNRLLNGSQNRYLSESPGIIRDFENDIQYMGSNGEWIEGVRCATLSTPEEVLINVQQDLENNRLQRSNQRNLVNVQVAWHVIYSSSGAGNISNEMISDQIDVLNDAYAPYDIFFTLDIVDYTMNDDWFNDMDQYENTYKQQLNIDPIHYLNIYTGNMPGLLGWSWLPYSWPEGSYMHGVCLLYSSLPGGSSYPYNAGDTATHEIGHYLGLLHTFENGCSVNNDNVSDTPQEDDGNNIYSCNATDTCPNDPGMDPVQNFMTYTDDACLNQFTTGQGDRMTDMIATYRPGLLENPIAPDWITVNENSFQVPANGSYDLAFSFDGSGLTGGDYLVNIYFEEATLDTTLMLPAILHIEGITGLDISFESLIDTLYTNEFSNSFLEMNYSGTDLLIYQFDYDISWVTVLGGDGTLENEESQFITFNLNSLFMDTGEYFGEVTLSTNMGSLPIYLTMVVLEPLGINDGTIPMKFAVSNNYPNPFNPSTQFSISLPERVFVNIAVYDLNGRKVATLINSIMDNGIYELKWEGKNDSGSIVSAGVYILKVDAGTFHYNQKLIFIK